MSSKHCTTPPRKQPTDTVQDHTDSIKLAAKQLEAKKNSNKYNCKFINFV